MITILSSVLHKTFLKIYGNHFEKNGFVTYTNNIQWFTIAKIWSLLLSFSTTVVTTRIFGPEQYGILNYVLSFTGLFSVLATLGIGTIVYRELTLFKEKREELLGSAFFLNMITSLVAILAISVTLFFVHESFYIKMLIVLMSLSFITQPLTLLSFDFLKDKEGKYVTITQIITLSLSSILKILSAYFLSSVTFFIAILIFENIITGLIYSYQIRKIKGRTLKFTVSKSTVLTLFSLSLPLVFYGAFSEIYARIDQIMLRSYIDIKAVGIYSAAVRITEIWYMVPNILLGALFPALANVKDNHKEYTKRFNILLFIFAALSVIISLAVFLSRTFLIRIIYGETFIVAAPVLGVYIFSIIGFFISLLLYQDLFLRTSNKWTITLIPFFTALLNIALNMLLIPIKGALGAALATTISYNLVAIGFYIAMKVRRK